MNDPNEQEKGQVSDNGALAQLEKDNYSRDKFFKLVGGASAISAFGFLLAACGDDSEKNDNLPNKNNNKNDDNDSPPATTPDDDTDTNTTPPPSETDGDLAIVNYALTLEYLEADFYQKVIDSGMFKGAQLELIKIIGQHENEHVEALLATAKTLGTPAAKPETKFPLENPAQILKLAATVENVGAAAYLGQAGLIKNPEILAAALAIHTVEARHASALNKLTGQNPTPDGAFAKPLSMEEVLPLVQPFIVASGQANGATQ